MTFKKAVILGLGFEVGRLGYRALVDIGSGVTEIQMKHVAKMYERLGVSPIDEYEKHLKYWPFSNRTKKQIMKDFKSVLKQ